MVKRIDGADAREIIRRTRQKVKVGHSYLLPLTYVYVNSEQKPKKKFVCTGKYEHFATFKNRLGVPQSFTYYDLAAIAKI